MPVARSPLALAKPPTKSHGLQRHMELDIIKIENMKELARALGLQAELRLQVYQPW